MKNPYAVFAQDRENGEPVLIRICSGRFARANRAALLAKGTYPGVFFSFFREVDGKAVPNGERFKPVHLAEASVVKTGYNPNAGRTILDGSVGKRKPRREKLVTGTWDGMEEGE